jgi:hypothetical protein
LSSGSYSIANFISNAISQPAFGLTAAFDRFSDVNLSRPHNANPVNWIFCENFWNSSWDWLAAFYLIRTMQKIYNNYDSINLFTHSLDYYQNDVECAHCLTRDQPAPYGIIYKELKLVKA